MIHETPTAPATRAENDRPLSRAAALAALPALLVKSDALAEQAEKLAGQIRIQQFHLRAVLEALGSALA